MAGAPVWTAAVCPIFNGKVLNIPPGVLHLYEEEASAQVCVRPVEYRYGLA
jgi:hypothetical protein